MTSYDLSNYFISVLQRIIMILLSIYDFPWLHRTSWITSYQLYGEGVWFYWADMISDDFLGPPELLYIMFVFMWRIVILLSKYDFLWLPRTSWIAVSKIYVEEVELYWAGKISYDFLGPPELLHTNFTKKEYDFTEQICSEDVLEPFELFHINFTKNYYDFT